jgi:hypothetical protein
LGGGKLPQGAVPNVNMHSGSFVRPRIRQGRPPGVAGGEFCGGGSADSAAAPSVPNVTALARTLA